jgi:hypothetical protein
MRRRQIATYRVVENYLTVRLSVAGQQRRQRFVTPQRNPGKHAGALFG